MKKEIQEAHDGTSHWTFTRSIGNISRFENAKQLVGYPGIGAGVHNSGKTHREKKITEKGGHAGSCLASGAEFAVWKEQSEKYLRRLHKPNQAIFVAARKLLIAIWHVLSKEEADVHPSAEDLSYRMLLLSGSLRGEVRLGCPDEAGCGR